MTRSGEDAVRAEAPSRTASPPARRGRAPGRWTAVLALAGLAGVAALTSAAPHAGASPVPPALTATGGDSAAHVGHATGRPVLERLAVRRRSMLVRVRVPGAGLLTLRLVGRGRRHPVGTARLARPLTVTFRYRAPKRVKRGRYVLRIRFAPADGPVTLIRRRVRIR